MELISSGTTKSNSGSVIFENEHYRARYPEGLSEAEAQEQFFVHEYKDNPRFYMLGIGEEDLSRQCQREREYEIANN